MLGMQTSELLGRSADSGPTHRGAVTSHRCSRSQGALVLWPRSIDLNLARWLRLPSVFKSRPTYSLAAHNCIPSVLICSQLVFRTPACRGTSSSSCPSCCLETYHAAAYTAVSRGSAAVGRACSTTRPLHAYRQWFTKHCPRANHGASQMHGILQRIAVGSSR